MKHLDPRRWQRLSAALDELLALAPAARDVRLAALRAADAALADELAALLAQETRIEDERFLDGAALDAPPTLAGQRIGAYTIERELGEGGMGSVWLARRSDGHFEGQVAVKLLNLALATRGGAERFAREGSLLARLAHPHIAHLYDAGVSAAGQPYLVLEHVQGEPIDRWCEARRLDPRARVRLVIDVLAAVAHAHSKLVLHRDIKPANILVTAEGQVKLLDFGIAKLLDESGRAGSPTRPATRAFTPDYAAPEQVEGGEVTTATDVYALGVLLYVLLTGAHPTALPTDSPAQRLRAVVDADPVPMSRRSKALGGDLETICAKALKKAPGERYATAQALADDLRRCLDDQPVSARADSLAYRASKFMRRHRLGVAAASATAMALVAGIVGTTWQAAEARRERDRAQALLGRNEAIVDFVDLMFTEAVPEGQSEAVLRLLERSERLLDGALGARPEHHAEMLRVLASYYTTLNLPDKQVALLQRARQIVESVPDRSLKARLACAHANALSVLGQGQEAAAILAPWITAADIEPAVGAYCLQMRAILAQTAADPQAALRHAEAGLARLRAATPPSPLLEATLLGDVGFAHRLAGRNAQADQAYGVALERLQALGRGDSSEAGRMRIGRGLVRYAMNDYAGGLQEFQRVLRHYELRGMTLMPPSVIGNVALGYEQTGRLDDAAAAYERTLEAARRNGFVAGQAFALVGRASVQVEQGALQRAQATLDEVETLGRGLPPAHSARVRQHLVQARVHAALGRFDAAAQACAKVIETLARQGAATPALATAHRLRAEAALRQGQRAPAAADAQRALELARSLQGTNPNSDLTGLAWLTLARVRQADGDAAGAREAARAARPQLAATLGAQHAQTQAAAALTP